MRDSFPSSYSVVEGTEGGSLASPDQHMDSPHAALSEDQIHMIEQTFVETKVLLSQSSRSVLLMVLNSLLDDYGVNMLGPITARLEAAANYVSSPHAVSPMVASQAAASTTAAARTPQRISPTPGNRSSTPTPSRRKSKAHKSKEEEQDMCMVHHNMRAIKHLQVNPVTEQLECIHGFHCLVTTPPKNPTPQAYTAGGSGAMKYTEEVSTVAPRKYFYSVGAEMDYQMQLQQQRTQQNELLKQQHDYLQRSHDYDPNVDASFGHIGNVPFALPTPSQSHADPSLQTREVSPEDEYLANYNMLKDLFSTMDL